MSGKFFNKKNTPARTEYGNFPQFYFEFMSPERYRSLLLFFFFWFIASCFSKIMICTIQLSRIIDGKKKSQGKHKLFSANKKKKYPFDILAKRSSVQFLYS